MRLGRVNRILGVALVLVLGIAIFLPVLGAEKGYPIPGNLELSIWCSMNPIAGQTNKSYADITAFKEAEKRTGVKIKWSNPASGLDKEQFNLMLVSRDLPDMFVLPDSGPGWFDYPGGAEKFYQDKIIVKMNDLIKKNAPNIASILRKYPEVRKQLSTDDGSIYFAPKMLLDPRLTVFTGFQIRQDWLDKLGLKVPVTMDDWYNVLKAFKTRDPNGNGQADEIPFVATRLSDSRDLSKFLGAWGVCFSKSHNNGFMQVRGKIVYSPIAPEFKQALTFLNRLYKEGLIDPDFAIQERKQFNVKILANQAGAWWGYAGSDLGNFMTQMKGKEPASFNISGAPWPIGPAKKPYSFESSPVRPVSGYGIAISTACKHPAEAMKWIDYAYGKEGNLLYNFGVEGLTYNMVNGYPKYTDLIMKNPDGLPVATAMAKHILGSQNWALVQDIRYFEQFQTPLAMKAIGVWTKAERDRVIPPLSLTAAESQAISSKLNEINTYAEEMYIKFIVGTVPLSDFDKFVSTIKQLGIDEVVKVYQAALQRYEKRK